MSIILPVYNVERYIEKCLISLLGKQDFEQTDYEVIIINDGSTDDVLSIIQRYTIQYSNIRIYNQKNQGQSAARNYGLKVAQGEYIWFVDPDDWIEDNVLKTLYQEVSEQQLDCLCLENLKNIMKNGEYRISLGTMHRWALKDFLSAKVVASKILMCLATATSARFMYVGQEVPLIDWILSRQDNSVTIEQLFEESYNLNKGNVYLTVLTIENVLSDSTFEADREKTAVNRKLSDLYAGSPNKFGDWYHLFGTMLAGYANEHAEAIADLYGVYRKISRGSNAEKATISADKIGAKMGRQLRQFVFDNDKELQRELVEQIKKRDNAMKYSHGNLKYIGPDGNAYIGFNR